jgi:hypothetical protein
MLHWKRVRPGGAARLTPAQDLGPAIGDTHQHAADWQAFKQKLMQFRHFGSAQFLQTGSKTLGVVDIVTGAHA